MRQNMYKQNYEAKGIQKYYSIHFVLDIYSRVLGLPRSMSSIFIETPLQKTSFPQKVNSNFIEILSQEQEPVQFTPSGLGLCLTRTCAGPLCAARISISSYMHQCCCVCNILFTWSYSSPLALIVVLLPFLHRSPDMKRI